MSKKKSSINGAFLAMPMAVLNCSKYRALSSSGVKLLFDIAMQYNGKNNGDLSAAWKIMKPKGWRSEATLDRAKKELLAAEFIAQTRQGRLPNLCTLYGVTWIALNPNAKLDVGPNGFPCGAWAQLPAEPPKKRARSASIASIDGDRIATEMGAGEIVQLPKREPCVHKAPSHGYQNGPDLRRCAL